MPRRGTDDEGMVTVSVLLTLHIPGAQTLKEKRAVVRSLVDRLRVRMQLSAAEVGRQDRPQSALVGFAVVSGDRGAAMRRVEETRRFVDQELLGRAEVVATSVEESVISADELSMDFGKGLEDLID